MKCETLRRLLPDARQAFEFVNEFGDRFGVIKHKEVSGFEFRVSSWGCKSLWLNSKLETRNSKLK